MLPPPWRLPSHDTTSARDTRCALGANLFRLVRIEVRVRTRAWCRQPDRSPLMARIWIALLAALSILGRAPAAEPADDELHAALKAQPRSAHGARIYANCVACHGKDGGGSTNGITPALAGQHARYLIKQIAEFRDHERFTGDVHDNAMREYIVNAQGIADLAAYLAELPP